jgi:hypothetical protein
MHLPHRFYKFPFRFDVERLRAEVEAFPEEAWLRHPQDYKGNSALPLIATNGVAGNKFDPPMLPTEHLLRSPYLLQVLGQFHTLLGRSRLMRLEPGDGVPPHFDTQYYWRSHTRVHIPIVTHPEVKFVCDDAAVHMAAGEAWTFDNWRMHTVINEKTTRRIHLTFDTYGSTAFWAMVRPLGQEEPPCFVPYQEGVKPQLSFETYVGEPAMPPGEVDFELSRLVSDISAVRGNNPADIALVRAMTVNLRHEWRMIWHAYGPTPEGLPHFRGLVQRMLQEVTAIPPAVVMASNGCPVTDALTSTFAAMVQYPLAQANAAGPVARAPISAPAMTAAPRFDRPVFIVSAPRSGSTLLFEMMAANAAFWTLGGEGHGHVETIAALNPNSRNLDSNRLTAADATAEVRAQLLGNFTSGLRTVDSKPWRGMDGAAPQSVRFLEKTPKNALRIPFFKAIFPDARFIYLQREAKANISAIIEAWRSGRFVTYRELPGWIGPSWSMLLIPGWRDLSGADVAEVAMRQWRDTNETIMKDLAALPDGDWCCVRYEDVVSDPAATLARLCTFADVPFGERMRALARNPLRPSRYTLTPPDPEKWRKNEGAMKPFLPAAQATVDKLATLYASRNHVGEAAQ